MLGTGAAAVLPTRICAGQTTSIPHRASKLDTRRFSAPTTRWAWPLIQHHMATRGAQMNRRRWAPAAGVAVLVLPLLVLSQASPAGAAPAKVGKFTLDKTLTPASTTSSAKTPTSKMAQTDPTLLKRTDSTP